MHEEALVQDLLRKTSEVARDHRARHVRSLTVWVGALSHLTEEQFRRRFELAAAGTVAEGAEVRIRRSEDLFDPRAQGVVLENVVVDPDAPATASDAGAAEAPDR